MKSYLVDVLRQADGPVGDDGLDKQRISAAEETPLASGGVDFSAATELGLLEIQEETVEVISAQPGPDAAESRNENDESAGRSSGAPFLATAMLYARGASLSGEQSFFARMGRLAPVLCLVAMSVAAGGYMLLDRLAFNNLNEDLADLSERARSNSRTGGAQDSLQDLPATDLSVIHEIETRKPGDAVPKPVNPIGSAILKAAETQKQASATESGSHRAGSNIRIGVTRNVDSIVNDRAYPSVLAAFNAYRERDYELAEEHYLRALEIEPHHLDALAGLAAVFQQTGQERRVVETYKKLLAIDPGNNVAASAIISLKSQDASWDAESELKHLLQLYPAVHHLHFMLGSYYVDQGRWADARHEFLAAHRLAPRNPDYSFNVAVSMENLGGYAEARPYFELAMATAETSSNIDKDVITQHLNEMTAQLREQL